MKISVIGLGKLGLPLATSIASKGFKVIGVDVIEYVVKNLNQGATHLPEPNLQKLITLYKKNISATRDVQRAVLNSDITFIITPTPSQKNGYFSLQYINAAVKEVAKSLKKKKSFHLIVIVSTVMPGSMQKIQELLEKNSGKTCMYDFGLCYNPEFIALGSVIENLLNPDFVLIGESDKKSGDILEEFYSKFSDNDAPISRMNFVNAELAKISVNTFVTTKISYANMLSEICEMLPGGNVDAVTSALALDSRIGGKYLKGGASFGGPCFPRDNIAFISFAKNLKATFDIPQATHKTNVKQIDRISQLILKYADAKKSVGILGLSYKPFTDVIEESTGLLLTQMLVKKHLTVNLHDPLALKNVEKIFNKDVNYIDDLEKCVKSSDIIVITTQWPEYKNIKKSWLEKGEKIIIDLWRSFNQSKLSKKTIYVSLGIGSPLE